MNANTNTGSPVYISLADTAKLVRKALAEAFSGVKFSVRCARGSSAIRVSWTDGPSADQVGLITEDFRGGYFDGSIDYAGSVYAMHNGQRVRFGADFITHSRDYSPAITARVLARVAAKYGVDGATVEAFERGQLWNVYPHGRETGYATDSVQGLVNKALARHTCQLASVSATAAAVEVIGSDGYSFTTGSGRMYGDDAVIHALRRA